MQKTGLLDDMLTRQVNGQNSFIADIVEQFGFTVEQAIHIFRVYQQVKVLEYQAGIGRYTVKHGAFWELQPMQNALCVELKNK